MHYVTRRSGEHISDADRLTVRVSHPSCIYKKKKNLLKLHKLLAHALLVMRTHACRSRNTELTKLLTVT